MTLAPGVSITPATIPKSKAPASIDNIALDWVARFNAFLLSRDVSRLPSLLHSKGYWRDILCLSWTPHTHPAAKVAPFLSSHPQGIRLKSIAFEDNKAPFGAPVDYQGNVPGVGVFLSVKTDIGTGRGFVRLVNDEDEKEGDWKAYTLYTCLQSIDGHEELLGSRRDNGVKHGADKTRRTWKQRREAEEEFSGSEEGPTVLIIGAGHAGLTAAARLKMLGISTLIIDKNENIGDNWRKRYDHLVLHDPVYYDHMPYLKFPEHWPVFTPKDKLADWFASYAKILELNVWMRSTLSSSSWDPKTKFWDLTIARTLPSGETISRVFKPKHLILATGHSGEPYLPNFPGMDSFKGSRICHSSGFPGAGPEAKGKKAIIVGCCNSGHDIAQDYYERGAASITMVQRSSTFVVTSESVVGVLLKGMYDENSMPTEDADLLFQGTPLPLLKTLHQSATIDIGNRDADILAGLTKVGFKLDKGPDDSGFFLKYFERGGGYYLDVGASTLIADGKIKIKQGQEVDRVLENGLEFADGSTLEADEIVFATGYDNMVTMAGKILGKEVVKDVGPVWGLDEEGELRGIWKRTEKEGLWFMGGNMALCRWWSKILALQILAMEQGLMKFEDL
ncbi:hypothetical protein RUND412_003321 [Rhizina undulata]